MSAAQSAPMYSKRSKEGWKFVIGAKFSCYMHNGVKMSGANGLLRKWFYPKWSFETARYSTLPEEKNKGGKLCKTQKADDAIKRGKRVDADLTYWTKHGILPEKPHPCSVTFAKYFTKNELKPFRAQRLVGIPEHGVGTPLDLILKNKEGELVSVECTTTTNNHSFEKSGGQMLSAPLDDVPSSISSHKLLEAAFGKVCWENEPGKTRPPLAHTWVVRVNYSDQEVTKYTADWLGVAEEDILKRIRARKVTKPKKMKDEKSEAEIKERHVVIKRKSKAVAVTDAAAKPKRRPAATRKRKAAAVAKK